MKKLFIIIMFVSCNSFADKPYYYDSYNYDRGYYNNPQIRYPDNVQTYIMQQQSEKARKSYENNATQQRLRDISRESDSYYNRMYGY